MLLCLEGAVSMALKQLTTKGRVYHRKDGYWFGDIRYIDENGIRKRKMFGAKTKKEAQQKIRDYKIQFQKEVEEADETKKTLQESMGKWTLIFKYPSVARATYDSNEGTAKNYIYPIIGDKVIGDIIAAELKSILANMMNRGYAHSTVKKTYTLLNQYFRCLYTDDIIPKNPMQNVSMIKKAIFLSIQGEKEVEPRDEITILTDEEIQWLKEEAFALNANGSYKHRQAAAYILMINTGLRTGEVLGILNSDIDFESRLLHLKRAVKEVNKRDSENKVVGRKLIVGKPKTPTSRRVVPLNHEAIRMIRLLQQKRYFGKDSPLIPNEEGTFTSPSSFRRRWDYLMCILGIEGKILHSLRHTFATKLVNGMKDKDGNTISLPLRKVADILGHSTSVITERYYVKRDMRILNGITDDFEIGR